MAVRIFNTCSNIHYLTEMGLEGICVSVNGGKDTRHVCSCGWVGKGDENCHNCGNTKWTNVNTSRWYYSSYSYIKSKEPVIQRAGNTFNIVETSLKISENSMKQLELSYEDAIIVEISLDEIKQNRRHDVSVSNRVDPLAFVLDHLDEITDDEIHDSIEEASRISLGIYNSNDRLCNTYKLLGYGCVNQLLDDTNIEKYRKFFKESFNRSDWHKENPYPGVICSTMEDLWKVMGLPVEYANYYASADFAYSMYYGYTKDKIIDINQLHKLPDDLQRTIKSCLEHKTIYLSNIQEIVTWSMSQKESTLLVLASFLKKHGMQYQRRVFDYFKEYLGYAHDAGYPEETILQSRTLSMLEAMALLKRRGFPDSRINAFADIFDVNPSIGLGLLGSKAQLKKNEAEKIYNK